VLACLRALKGSGRLAGLPGPIGPGSPGTVATEPWLWATVPIYIDRASYLDTLRILSVKVVMLCCYWLGWRVRDILLLYLYMPWYICIDSCMSLDAVSRKSLSQKDSTLPHPSNKQS